MASYGPLRVFPLWPPNTGMDRTFRPYRDVAPRIPHGALLLWRRGRKLSSRLIAGGGRGEWSHASRAAWNGPVIDCLEMLQFRGGHVFPLADYVAKYPRRIDVFWPCQAVAAACGCAWSADVAMTEMRRIVGTHPYGWRNIFRAARWHYPILRLFGKPPTDDAANGSAPHCAMASVLADKAGGFDPCPLLADYATEPNDLARSLFYAHGYMFTLE